MVTDRLALRDILGAFAPGQPLRAALVLTYSFDGRWFEEVMAPDLFERPVAVALVIRDRNALIAEASSLRYRRADAAFSTRVFHPKLLLLVAEDRALAFLGSANTTRGGFERNLELGQAFEIGREGGPKFLFRQLHRYIADLLRREVAAASRTALEDIGVALREVLGRVPAEATPSPHVILHNYDKPLWEQLLALAPHRFLRRAIIMSPFYEPDASSALPLEDPVGQSDDTSAFERLFADFTFEPTGIEKPLTIYFQEDHGVTQLPLKKLERWASKIAILSRLHTTDDARPLHAKFLVLEGEAATGRKPFLLALSGSPNFTSAAWLSTPPNGNAELAVLTHLPLRSGGARSIVAALGLDRLFAPVPDWGGLNVASRTFPPSRPREAFTVTDVILCLDAKLLELSLENVPPNTVQIRVLAEIGGRWSVVSGGPLNAAVTARVPAAELLATDLATGIPTVKACRVRVEALDSDENVLAYAEAPLNVDRPELFCGLAMVEPVLLGLDQRIAQAGSVAPLTYRDQQKWLEELRSRHRDGAPEPTNVLTHQADLDRFYRNLHTGFRGLRIRLERTPRSEFTLRRTLRDLARWCMEAIAPEANVPSEECRLFLLDRLVREISGAVERGEDQPALISRLPKIAAEVELMTAIEAAGKRLHAHDDERVGSYARESHRRAAALHLRLRALEAGA
ncbi:MAG: hypothetical protein HY695_12080 [Deltaproteobacteria bacterium]|nr:hypothetical protein [Deltaproteobacteria bacterium]